MPLSVIHTLSHFSKSLTNLQKYVIFLRIQIILCAYVVPLCGVFKLIHAQLVLPCTLPQEPGTEEDIKRYAAGFGVKFDMFSKIDVNGSLAHPLYKYLKKQLPGNLGRSVRVCVSVHVCAGVCVCVRACVRACVCVHAYLRVCVMWLCL